MFLASRSSAHHSLLTTEMSPSKCVRRTLPTTSTFSEDPGRWPVVGPCWSRWLLPPPSSGPTLRPCEIWRSSGPALDSFVKKLAVSFARLWCAVAELASPANAIRNSTTRATELRRISHLPLEDCSAWHPGGRPGGAAGCRSDLVALGSSFLGAPRIHPRGCAYPLGR